MKFIKEKDWKNILEMIESYYAEVIIIRGYCPSCEYWGLVSCKYPYCKKIYEGMKLIFGE